MGVTEAQLKWLTRCESASAVVAMAAANRRFPVFRPRTAAGDVGQPRGGRESGGRLKLDDLGWSPFFERQLVPDDPAAWAPGRVLAMQRSGLTVGPGGGHARSSTGRTLVSGRTGSAANGRRLGDLRSGGRAHRARAATQEPAQAPGRGQKRPGAVDRRQHRYAVHRHVLQRGVQPPPGWNGS